MSPKSVFKFVLVVSALLALSAPISAQSNSVNPRYTAPKSPNDTAYGAKIAEYTTEKYFMTELVDHLPLSDKVPSPEKVLGYAIGTPNKLTYTKDQYRYYRELAAASPDRKSTRLNSSHGYISYAVFCLKKK